MQLALYQPDQPQNTGTILRLGACLDVPVHIIEPCGFPFSIKALRRAAMDYIDHVEIIHHVDFEAFEAWRSDHKARLILLTTKASEPYTEAEFAPSDILLLGQESSGVPANVHRLADLRLLIPMKRQMRSLNIAVSASMVLGEALRQTSRD